MKAVRNFQTYVQQTMAGRMKYRLARRFAVALLALIVMVPMCMAQETKSQAPFVTEAAPSAVDPHKTIYVVDFDLDSSNFKQDRGGITGKGYLLPPPPKSFLRRKRQDPARAASDLVELMSINLVRDLQKAGFLAVRLLPTDPRPTDGLLLTGVFTELDEGNQMRRALIGFGSGKAKMELYVMVVDASSAEQPLYETSARKSNGKAPGTLIALNPYAGAAGFVVKFGMTKNAPEKMVKQTASKIAAELTKQRKAEFLVAAEQELHRQ
jgi:hypothetical protein